jgi:hypothetical protein
MPPPGRDPNVTYFDSDRRPLPGTEFQNNSGRYPIGGPYDPGGQQFPGWVDPNSGYVIEYDRDGNPYYAWYPNGQYQGGNPFIDGDALMKNLMYPRYTADRLPDPNWRPSRPGETPPWINNPAPYVPPPPTKEYLEQTAREDVVRDNAANQQYESDRMQRQQAQEAGAVFVRDNKKQRWGVYYPPGYQGPKVNIDKSRTPDRGAIIEIGDPRQLGQEGKDWQVYDLKGGYKHWDNQPTMSFAQASQRAPQPGAPMGGAPAQQQNFGAPAPSQGANSMMGFGGGFGGGGMMRYPSQPNYGGQNAPSMGYGAQPQPNTGPANNPGMGGGPSYGNLGAFFGSSPQGGMNDMAAKMKQMSAGNQGGAAPNFANMFSGMQNMFNNAGGPQMSGGNMGNMGASLGNAMSAYGQGNPFGQVQQSINAMAPAYGMRPNAGGGSEQNPGQMPGMGQFNPNSFVEYAPVPGMGKFNPNSFVEKNVPMPDMEDNNRQYRDAMAAANQQPKFNPNSFVEKNVPMPGMENNMANYYASMMNPGFSDRRNYFSSMMNPYGGMGGMGFGFNPFRMGRPNFY